jgi:trk system potassium uptake protein TrkA
MRIVIVGAGQLGRALATDLLHAGNDVHVLDADSEALGRLSHDFEGRSVHGSPLDRAVLAGAADGCDALAAVTDDDNLNAVVAISARRELGLPLALAVVANAARAEALAGLGAHVLCPTTRTARNVASALVRSGLETELPFAGDAALYRAEVPVRLAGRTLADLGVPGEIVPVAVERGARILLASDVMTLQEGDVLHIAAAHSDALEELMRP